MSKIANTNYCKKCGVPILATAEWMLCQNCAAEMTPSPLHKQRNVGMSNYAEHTIQPWDIWREYNLNPWDADIIKRVLRTKKGDSRKSDYEKIMHICEERIAQLDGVYNDTAS